MSGFCLVPVNSYLPFSTASLLYAIRFVHRKTAPFSQARLILEAIQIQDGSSSGYQASFLEARLSLRLITTSPQHHMTNSN